MKIKRYFAPDIRQAMRMVREEQGPDAVILSNRRVEGGVEIVAALDFDEQSLQEKLAEQAIAAPAAPAVAEAPPQPTRAVAPEAVKVHIPQPSPATVELLARLRSSGAPQRAQAAAPAAAVAPAAAPPPAPALSEKARAAVLAARSASQRPVSAAPAKPAASVTPPPRVPPVAAVSANPYMEATPAPAATVNSYMAESPRSSGSVMADAGSLAELQQELRSLRKVVDMRLAEAGWQASSRNQNPTRLDLLRGLCERGFSKQVALHLANRLGSLTDSDAAWRQAKEILTRQLPVADDQLLEYGGIAALVGPTGVGKTTTIAKLAAKFRLKHGPRQLALITVDNYRIAAHDHLNAYGRILDVPVAIASNADELQHALQGFLDKKLVLIDTAGMGQHDGRLMEQLSLLRGSSVPIRPYLVMSASTQMRGMEEVVRAFGDCQPHACILTKVDEAASPATALSVLMQHGLPLAFMADGQQVPEDLHVARAADLIQRCFSTPLDTEEAANSYTFEDWVANGAL